MDDKRLREIIWENFAFQRYLKGKATSWDVAEDLNMTQIILSKTPCSIEEITDIVENMANNYSNGNDPLIPDSQYISPLQQNPTNETNEDTDHGQTTTPYNHNS